MNRLTDNDHNFGPFTFARWTKNFRLMLRRGGGEDDGATRNNLLIVAFGWSLRICLPNIIQPYRIRHDAHWDAETVARLGRNHWFECYEREYGFSLSDMGNGYDFLQVRFGAQTHSSDTTQDWCCHLPWKQSRMVRFSLYDTEGLHFWTEMQDRRKRGMEGFKDQWAAQEACPKDYFLMRDYDGAEITATTYIEEREWYHGTGWFKWLSYFNKPIIRRCLDIQFSAEVGPEKGSWKGGTVGHGIDMLPGETPEQAFRRYCANGYNDRKGGRICPLTYLGRTTKPPERLKAKPSADCGCDQAVCAK